jgi:hypothetical protein
MADIEQTGPIDWFLIEFEGKEITGGLVPPLLDLVDRRLIRILDALVIIKDGDKYEALTSSDLESRGLVALGPLAGASSGILTDEDAAQAAGALGPDSRGLILVYENLWAVPFAVAARKAGGLLVADGRIHVQDMLARLDELGV